MYRFAFLGSEERRSSYILLVIRGTGGGNTVECSGKGKLAEIRTAAGLIFAERHKK